MDRQEKQVSPDITVEQAYRSERKRLLGFIRRRVRTEEDAEDILQDVFYQLLSGYSVTEPIEKLTSWLFTATKNKIIDWYRKRKPEPMPSRVTRDDDEAAPLNLEEILFDPAQNADEAYANSLVWSELAGCSG